jgi:hypothetical protein
VIRLPLVLGSGFLPWSFGLMATGFTALGTKSLPMTVLRTAHFSEGLDVEFAGIVPISVQYICRTRSGGTYVMVRVYEDKSSPLRQPRRRAQPDVGYLNCEDLSSYTLTNLECNLICQHSAP